MGDRSVEIALALSATPPAISNNAEVLVLGRHNYETAVEGKNGCVCVVERSWMSPPDIPEFWNPKVLKFMRGAMGQISHDAQIERGWDDLMERFRFAAH